MRQVEEREIEGEISKSGRGRRKEKKWEKRIKMCMEKMCMEKNGGKFKRREREVEVKE